MNTQDNLLSCSQTHSYSGMATGTNNMRQEFHCNEHGRANSLPRVFGLSSQSFLEVGELGKRQGFPSRKGSFKSSHFRTSKIVTITAALKRFLAVQNRNFPEDLEPSFRWCRIPLPKKGAPKSAEMRGHKLEEA